VAIETPPFSPKDSLFFGFFLTSYHRSRPLRQHTLFSFAGPRQRRLTTYFLAPETSPLLFFTFSQLHADSFFFNDSAAIVLPPDFSLLNSSGMSLSGVPVHPGLSPPSTLPPLSVPSLRRFVIVTDPRDFSALGMLCFSSVFIFFGLT